MFLRGLLVSVFGLSLYFLFYLPFEFFLTEVCYFTPKFNPWLNTLFLFVFLLISLFLIEVKKIIRFSKVLLILFLVSFAGFIFYRQEKIKREYWPKIYKIEPSWVIQGQKVSIEGVNFGRPHERGEVFVDEMKLLVRDWSEKKINAEVPVPFSKGSFSLYIVDKKNQTSNKVFLEIKDPGYLKRFMK